MCIAFTEEVPARREINSSLPRTLGLPYSKHAPSLLCLSSLRLPLLLSFMLVYLHWLSGLPLNFMRLACMRVSCSHCLREFQHADSRIWVLHVRISFFILFFSSCQLSFVTTMCKLQSFIFLILNPLFLFLHIYAGFLINHELHWIEILRSNLRHWSFEILNPRICSR